MIGIIVVVVMAVGLAGYAEWRHFKSGNGKRFEQIHNLLNSGQE
jgi:hypothetical protein